MQGLERNSTSQQVTFAIVSYSLCSSTLLLANKAAMIYIPYPSVVSFIQIIASVIIIFALMAFGVQVDKLEWHKIKAYAMYIVAFVAAIFANMKALQHSNVETVIVFRACTPLAVSLIEYTFMGRSWPTPKAQASLIVVFLGAVVYCFADSELSLKGLGAYFWVSIYFVLITFEMTYGKKLTSSVKMDSVWGPVLYCNLLAALPMFSLGYFAGDFDNVSPTLAALPSKGMAILIFSCIAGTLIGYTGWLCRGMVSATTYTLVGVVNKFITVLLNVILWDKHSTPLGLIAVCICLGAGVFYEQAPMREVRTSSDEDALPLLERGGQKK